jgi:ribosomal protein S16
MTTDLQQWVFSFSNQGSWNTGNVLKDDLTPGSWGRIATPYATRFRKIPTDTPITIPQTAANEAFHHFYLPESLYLHSPTLYLQCKLPALSAGNTYVDNVGLHILKSLVFLSGGQTVYQIDDVRRHMWPDYINSLGTQQKATFLATMFGGASSGDARTVMVPVPLFSSAYYCRGGYQNPHGAWPAQSFRGQRIEIQIKIANTTEWVATGAGPTDFVEPPKIVVKEIYPTQAKISALANQRGTFSLNSREFFPIGGTKTSITAAQSNGTHQTDILINKPDGTFSEFVVIAQPTAVTNANRFTFVRPTYMKLEMDSAIVQEYEDSDVIRMLHYSAGYEGTEAEVPARYIFGAHTGRYAGFYVGGINFDNCTNVLLSLRFNTSAAVDFEVIGIRYCKFVINSSGLLRKSYV